MLKASQQSRLSRSGHNLTQATTRFILLCIFICALALITLAVPRLVSGVLIARHEVTLNTLNRGINSPPLIDVLQATQDYGQAVEWHATAKTWREYARLLFAAARGFQQTRPNLTRSFIRDGIRASEKALADNPIQPYVWVQLAQARLSLEGPNAAFHKAYIQSIKTAPYHRPLYRARILMGFDSYASLNEEARALFEKQIVQAGLYAPIVLKYLRPHLSAVKQRFLIRALATDPQALTNYRRQ